MYPTNKVNFVFLLRTEKLVKNENLFRRTSSVHKYVDTCSCIICVFMWLITIVSKLVMILNIEIGCSLGGGRIEEVNLNLDV